MRRNLLKSLAAVLAGNAIYFLLLAPYAPPAARHQPLRPDLGLLLDFGLCVIVYAALQWADRRWSR
ncbi:MAG TPA: hypothetical protein VFA60_09625 [Terriglobales bacterium]|nr:hypothetical protein [Terriglobales bacterium]